MKNAMSIFAKLKPEIITLNTESQSECMVQAYLEWWPVHEIHLI
jgi:hypothetical protein